jgi:hypothetical protein
VDSVGFTTLIIVPSLFRTGIEFINIGEIVEGTCRLWKLFRRRVTLWIKEIVIVTILFGGIFPIWRLMISLLS